MGCDIENEINDWVTRSGQLSHLEPGDAEEIRLHLIDKYEDLIGQGFSTTEAFEATINDFNDQKVCLGKEYERASLTKRTNSSIIFIMIFYHLKSAFNSILRNKKFTVLNLVGLTVAITASILITQYIAFESSHDQFIQDYKKIYRVSQDSYNVSDKSLRGRYASSFYALAPTLKEQFVNISAATRIYGATGAIRLNDDIFTENNIYYSESSFFDVFSDRLIEGNPTDLDKPNTVFISEEVAFKIFGEEEIIGQNLTMSLENGSIEEVEVRGVFKDWPANSHTHIAVLLPMENFKNFVATNNLFGDLSLEDVKWRMTGLNHYVKLKNEVDASEFQKQLRPVMENNRGSLNEERGIYMNFVAQRIDKIHLEETRLGDIKEGVDSSILMLLEFVVIVLLSIAWINIVNLTTAKSIDRAKEVGVRKIVGATRDQLFYKFSIESMFINFGAVLLSVLIVYGSHQHFEEFIGHRIFGYSPVWNNYMVILAVIISIGVLLSSIYTSFILSSFKPHAVLKGKYQNSKLGFYIRRILATVQIAASLFLLIAIGVLLGQINHMKNSDLGFDLDSYLIVERPSSYDSITNSIARQFVNRLSNDHTISSLASSNYVPGQEVTFRTSSRKLAGSGSEADVFLNRLFVSDDFLDFYDINLIEGRNFSVESDANNDYILINRTAAEEFGYEDPSEALGEKVVFLLGDTLEIVGVIEDHAQQGLKIPYGPICLQYSEVTGRYISISSNVNSNQVLSSVENTFEQLFKDVPFEYFYLDAFYNIQYQGEEKNIRILALFSFLALSISCLGIFGMASYLVRIRRKEMTLRKIHGASSLQVLVLLGKDFFITIILAALLIIPLSYFATSQWLDNYAFKMNLNPVFFIVPLLSIFIIVYLIIGTNIVKAAFTKPAKMLRED